MPVCCGCSSAASSSARSRTSGALYASVRMKSQSMGMLIEKSHQTRKKAVSSFLLALLRNCHRGVRGHGGGHVQCVYGC